MLPEITNGNSLTIYEQRYKALNEKISLESIGLIFLYLNKKRGFKSSKKDELAEDKETGKVKTAISDLKIKIDDANCRTVGEYFYKIKSQHQQGDNHQERITGNWVGREMYEHEFDLIWEKQKQYYPNELNDSSYIEFKQKTIFYQRKLKSQKHLINKCRFEPNKRVAPKSSIPYQEFRLWQKLADLRVTTTGRVHEPLTIVEKNMLAAKLWEQGSMLSTSIKSTLKFSKSETEFNDIDELKGITTHIKLLAAIGDEYKGYTEERKHQLWNTLFFFDDADKLKQYSINKLGFSETVAANYAKIKLEPDYGNVSIKAINKILPFLKEGLDYTKACEKAGYHHSFDEEKDSKDRVLEDFVPYLAPNGIRNPVVQKSVNVCVSIANDIIKLNGKPDVVKIELSRELKKPRHVRDEMRRGNREREDKRRMLAEFLTKTGLFKGEIDFKSSMVDKYMLWLELGCEDEGNEAFRKFAKEMKKSDLEKYKLWLECNRISPYTGKPISLTRLFDGDIEIEHIIPYSKSLDNSLTNKTLSERSFNADKGNQLPFEYFENKPGGEWESFVQRVRHFDKGKKEKFLAREVGEGFLNSQLTNTGYIGKVLLAQTKKAFKTVEIRNGQATAELRRLWGLNGILSNRIKDTDKEEVIAVKNILKNRNDHRHHAIDAIVIGCTTNRDIQLLSSYSHIGKYGKLENDEIQEPWRHFYEDIESIIGKLLVSHDNRKRLVTSSINNYRHSISKKQKSQTAKAASGPLHEETLYGQIKHPETGELVFVSKKDVATIEPKQLEKVIDAGIREAIQDHWDYKGKIDHVKNPLLVKRLWNGTTKTVKVRHVRVENRASKMVQLRPKENPELFVPTGSNYCIAIYEGQVKGKQVRDYVNVSFLEAVKKSIAKQPLFAKSIVHSKTNETLDLVMVLKTRDMVLLYNEREDEINWNDPIELFDKLYYILKWSGTSGQIFMYKHNIVERQADSAPKPILIRQNCGTFKGVKVKINRLGHLTRL